MIRLTTEQIERLNAIVEAWNRVRDDSRRPATVGEVIDFLITGEETGIAAMLADEQPQPAATKPSTHPAMAAITMLFQH